MSAAPADARDHLTGIARGGAVGLAGAASSSLSAFALIVIVTRLLPVDRAGTFFAATAAFLIVTALAGLGTETGLARFLLRQVADGRGHDVRATVRYAAYPALGVSVGCAIVLVVVADALAPALGLGPTGPATLQILAPAIPIAVAAELCLATTRAMADLRSTAVIDGLVRSALQSVLVLVALLAGGGIQLATALWAAAYVVSLGLAWPAARRCLRVHAPVSGLPPTAGVRAAFWSFTWPRGLTRLAQIVIQKADIVLVAALLSPTHAAVYTAATRFVAFGQFATQALQRAIQPRLTLILHGGDRQTLREVYRVATSWNISLTWPIYLVIGCAPATYLGLFGAGYRTREAMTVVVVMLVAMLLAVASGPVDTLLLMAGRSRTSLVNALTSAALDVGLCLWLVPRFGIVGAAAAWACAVLVRCSLAFLQVRRHLGVTPLGTEVGLAVALTLITVGAPVAAFSTAGGTRLGSLIAVAALAATAYLIAIRRLREQVHVDLLVAALRPRRQRSGTTATEETPMNTRRVSVVRMLLRRARGHLPHPLATASKALVLLWGRLTADVRMTPSFIVVGAQRAGTTTLFRLLSEHPELVRPTVSKGTGYFDDEFHRGPRWYRAHFPLWITGVLRTRSLRRAQTFECSGYYMFHPLAAERIAATLPDVRLVVMVRDPVNRAHSAYQHELSRGFETLSFSMAVALEEERTMYETHLLERDPEHRSFHHRHHAYLARSRYAEQVRRLTEAVGPDRVRVVDADAFFADPVAEFLDLQSWLGLRPWRPAEVPVCNTEERAPLPERARQELLAYFADADADLAPYLGRTPSWRTAEVARSGHAS